MNIIYGLYQPSQEKFGERPVGQNAFTRDAIDLGIGMVHQHFQLVPVMTVVENVMLGSESVRQGLLDRERFPSVLSSFLRIINWKLTYCSR